jgi:pilus assembly protein CpaB
VNRRTLTLVIAAVLAVGAGLLTFDYLLSVNKAPSSPPRSVLVAAQDIPARAAITSDLVRVVTRPSDTVDPNALSNPGDVASGSEALIAIPSGSTITSANIGAPTAQASPVHLRAGMRAVSIPVDMVKAIAGLVQPGDLVDVIASPPRNPAGQPKAYTIMRSIRVLAVGSAVEAMSNASPPPPGVDTDPRTITLEVTPSQADLLTMADLNATLRLALRSPTDKSRPLPSEDLVFATQSMGGGNPGPAAPSKPGAPSGPQRLSISPVTVIDGDQVIQK